MTPTNPRLRWTTPHQRKADMAPLRTIKVAVSLNEAEHARWKAAAAADGRAEVGRWVRETIEAGFETPADVVHSSKSTALLRAQARSLAQIAQLLEQALDNDGITPHTLEGIEAAVLEAKQLRPE